MKKLVVLSLLSLSLLAGCGNSNEAKLAGYVDGCGDLISEILAAQGGAADPAKLKEYCAARGKAFYKNQK